MNEIRANTPGMSPIWQNPVAPVAPAGGAADNEAAEAIAQQVGAILDGMNVGGAGAPALVGLPVRGGAPGRLRDTRRAHRHQDHHESQEAPPVRPPITSTRAS